MKVKSEELVELLVSCGYASAAEWNEEKLRTRLEKLEAVVDQAGDKVSASQQRLAEKIIKAQQSGDPVEIEYPFDTTEKPEKPAKRKKAEREETQVIETPTDTEESGEEKPKKKPGKKPTKEKSPAAEKAKPGNKGVGVIASIVNLLRKGSSKRPVTRETALEKLVEKYPDRDRDGMRVTVNSQLPKRIRDRKDVGSKLKDNGKGGFWIED